MSIKIIMFLFGLIFTTSVFAQNDIDVIYKITEDSIFLRWAPSSISAWKEGNHKGYILEVYQVDVTRQGASTKPVSNLWFRPKSVNEWANVKDDTIAMVAANSIFYSYDHLNKVEQYNIEKINYSMALFASDVSKKAAIFSGLYTTLPNRLMSGPLLLKLYIPNASFNSDTTLLYLDRDIKKTSYSDVPLLKLDNDGRQLTIIGNMNGMEKFYSYYNIECSYDNVIFFKLNKNKYVVDNKTKLFAFKDSIRKDTLYYRIQPVDYFYEPQKYSPVYKFIYHEVKDFVIVNHRVEGNTLLLDLNELVAMEDSVQLSYYTSPNSTPKNVSFEIHSNTLKVEIGNDGYYSVGSKNKISPLYYIVLEDTIPPNILNKKVSIHVGDYQANLAWEPYEDVRYVNIYIKNNPLHQWMLHNIAPVKDTFYHFKISKNFMDTISIGVSFLDVRYNESELLVYNILLKDTLPPVPAVLDFYKIDTATVYLKWFVSSSFDYHSQRLILVNGVDTITYPLNKYDSAFRFSMPTQAPSFLCFIQTTDNSGNTSFSKGLTINKLFNHDVVTPKFFKVHYKEEYNLLFWEENIQVKYIHIYRILDSTYTWLKTLTPNTNSYLDYSKSGDQRYFIVTESFSGVLSNKIYVE